MSACGCGRCPQCRGVRTSTPSRRTLDPLTPGGRRIATWADARGSMQAGLSGHVEGGGDGIPNLRTRDDDDPIIALADATAVVVDVLDFYTDRLGRESVLGTAAQADSIDLLGRAVGYRAAPGIAAETAIAFDVEPIARSGDIPPSVIPVGARIMNAPGPGERSVTFETVEELVARPEWNTLRMSRWGAGHATPIGAQPRAVRIRGTSVPVAIGDALLLEARSGTTASVVVVVSAIEQLPEEGVTVLRWAAVEPLTGPFADSVLDRVSVLGPQVSAFVKGSHTWQSVSVEFGRIRAGVGMRVIITADFVVPVPVGAYDNARLATVTDRVEKVWQATAPAEGWVPYSVISTALSGGSDLVNFRIRDVLQELPLAAVPLPAQEAPHSFVDVVGDSAAPHPFRLPRRVVVRTGTTDAVEAIVTDAQSHGTFNADGTPAAGARLTFADPLTGSFAGAALDPATTSVRANVAAATHGESKSVILGSGDRSRAGQSFALREVPIAWIRDADGPRSTLRVRVNGVLWHERRSFFGARADDRVYVVETAADGSTRILFGGPHAGSLLPDGNNNVVASVRIGCDPSQGPTFSPGNVRRGALTTLVDRPLGVISCVNHVPAVGGVDPPTASEQRTRIPIGLRAFRRAVSPLDYVDLALEQPGVAKARVDVIGGPRDRKVVLTVAGVGDQPGRVQQFSDTAELSAYLRGLGDPHIPLFVVGYTEQETTVQAQLQVDPDRDADQVRDDARALLRRRFAPTFRDLGATLHSSDIVAVLHELGAVAWVRLTSPSLRTGSAGTRIPGMPAETSAGGVVRGATLLVDLAVDDVAAVTVGDLEPERWW